MKSVHRSMKITQNINDNIMMTTIYLLYETYIYFNLLFFILNLLINQLIKFGATNFGLAPTF